jgi:hypothetical protein
MEGFIGGERFLTPAALFRTTRQTLQSYGSARFPGMNLQYTGGGFHSLVTVLQSLNVRRGEHVLVPSYLCSSILEAFRAAEVAYRFYEVSDRLRVELTPLEQSIEQSTRGIYIISYFGYPFESAEREFFLACKSRGLTIIEDAVHSCFSTHPVIGNFAFNSFRKFLPVAGSVLASEQPVRIDARGFGPRYSAGRCAIQTMRYLQYNMGIDFSRSVLRQVRKSEQDYCSSGVARMTAVTRYLLERIPFDETASCFRREFRLLYESMSRYSLLDDMPGGTVPPGFPIVIRNRDKVRKLLADAGIYCPVHWTLPGDVDAAEFSRCRELSEHILTVPLGWNIGKSHISTITSIIQEMT